MSQRAATQHTVLPSPVTTAMAMLQAELELQQGPVPMSLDGVLLDRGNFIASRHEFVLNVAQGLRFHYRRGAGVRYATGPHIGSDAVASFHRGSVYGALAWMHELVPLHASAIVLNGRVHAFAGASGAGKSTLVAALEERGLPVFADDVLTLVPGEPVTMALPGHKQLKLWGDALTLTGKMPKARVWPGVDKYYVDHVGAGDSPLPLASLTLIEGKGADNMAIVKLQGIARFAALRDACYRPDLRLPHRRESVFAQLAELAEAVPVFHFSRPRDLGRFAEGVEFVTTHIRGIST